MGLNETIESLSGREYLMVNSVVSAARDKWSLFRVLIRTIVRDTSPDRWEGQQIIDRNSRVWPRIAKCNRDRMQWSRTLDCSLFAWTVADMGLETIG